jgi:hypothetical protein
LRFGGELLKTFGFDFFRVNIQGADTNAEQRGK